VWILYFLESPYHTPPIQFQDKFNWTATYRWDSDVVAPYERWEYYDQNVKSQPQSINYAATKTKQVGD
jgi:Fucosyltransferase, N-terminal